MKARTWSRLPTLGPILFVLITVGDTQSSPTSNPVILHLPGIPGPYCAYGVEKRLMEREEVEKVTMSWEKESLIVSLKEGMELSSKSIEEVMKKADYPYRYSIQR